MKRKLAVLVAVLFLVGACAALTGTTPQQTLKKQGIMWTQMYASVFDDVKAVLTNPSSTAAQREIALKKAGVLVKMHPLLTAYVDLIDKGGVPSASSTQGITDLINQLVSLSGGV